MITTSYICTNIIATQISPSSEKSVTEQFEDCRSLQVFYIFINIIIDVIIIITFNGSKEWFDNTGHSATLRSLENHNSNDCHTHHQTRIKCWNAEIAFQAEQGLC